MEVTVIKVIDMVQHTVINLHIPERQSTLIRLRQIQIWSVFTCSKKRTSDLPKAKSKFFLPNNLKVSMICIVFMI